MYWALWDVESRNLVEDFATEEEALQAILEILAVNRPDYVDALALAAMYDEGEPREAELPPALRGEALRTRLAEIAQEAATDGSRKVHERIRRWLNEEGWHIRDVHDPKSSFNAMVTLQNDGPNVNIFQYKTHVDHITLSQHCVFDERSRVEISHLPINVQRKIVHRIYRDASIMGVDLSGLAVPSTELTIRAYVYFDGLTKDSLIQRILLTIRALWLSLQTFVEALEEAAYPAEMEESEPPAEQAANGEAGYSVEVKTTHAPDELPSNVVRLRPRMKAPAGDGDPRTVAS